MTRAEAKAANLRHYDTCKPCSQGHIPTVRRVCSGTCLECERISVRDSYVNNREMHLSSSRRWKENNKERVAAYFEATKPQKKARMAAYRAANHAELVVKKREWRHKNPDKERIQRQRYYATHKKVLAARFAAWAAKKGPMVFRLKANARRALRLAAGSHTKADILRLLAVQRGRCVYCRCDIRKTFTVDHIIPLVRGGSNNPGNLQLACKRCNSSKGAKHPADFARSRGLLV